MDPLKNFGLTTSVKGIPRAVKSKSRAMRILWSVCVVSFLTAACFQSYHLTEQYMAFSITTTLSEYIVEGIGPRGRNVELPDISICNTNPFGTNVDGMQDVPTVKEYYERVLNITTCNNCSSSQKLGMIRKYLLSRSAYSDYIGPDNVRKVGHTLESILVDCQLIHIEGRVFDPRPCFPGTNVSYRYDINFFNCYTLQLPTPLLPDNVFFGVTLVLHLDNFFQDHLMYFDRRNVRNRMAGIELNLHRPNTTPLMDFDSIFIPPGFIGHIQYRFEKQIRMSDPYGKCVKHMDDNNDNRRPSRDSCFASCIQAEVAKICNCTDINPYTDTYKNDDNFTKCFDIDRSREDMLQTWDCVIRGRRAAMERCHLECKPVCDELIHNAQVGDCIERYCLSLSILTIAL